MSVESLFESCCVCFYVYLFHRIMDCQQSGSGAQEQNNDIIDLTWDDMIDLTSDDMIDLTSDDIDLEETEETCRKLNNLTFQEAKGPKSSGDKESNDSNEARERLMAHYRRGDKRYILNKDEFDALVMLKVVEYLNNKSDLGDLRTKLHFKLRDQINQARLIKDLNYKVGLANRILKKLTKEKKADKPWTRHVKPVRIQREVGLQVCTMGSSTVS